MRGQSVERIDGVVDARLRQRSRAHGRSFDLLLALPIDHLAEPNVEGDKRHAGEQHARSDRDNIPARECAQKPTHPSAGAAPPGVLVVSHAAVKARLSLRRGKPDRTGAHRYG